MDEWFYKVEQVFTRAGLDSLPTEELQHYTWNCDERGFCTAVASKKILVRRMCTTHLEEVAVISSQCLELAVLMAHLYHLLLYIRETSLGQVGPSGCVYTVSDSG